MVNVGLKVTTVTVTVNDNTTLALPQGLYVHIPFCRHRCWYCDFAVVTGHSDLADRYLDALAAEWRRQQAMVPGPVLLRSIFVGGGTPTELTPRQLQRLLSDLRTGPPWADDIEVSIEANPDGFSEAHLTALLDAGVTRISLGGQSFQARHLAFLERQHTPADVFAAVRRVQAAGLRVAVDLIFGIPGQTLAEWRDDLETVLALGVGHVSTYGLTYEKGTRLWKAWQRGLITPIENEREAQMYELAMDLLPVSGFEHYEISNFAHPGQQCRHNELYWANAPYFGIGLGAARYLCGTRSVNTRSLKTYLDACLAGKDPQQSAETLPPDQRARETAMLNLRRRRGIHRQEFATQTGLELDSLLGATLRRLVEQGLLVDDGASVFLSRQGRLLADDVLGAVLTAPQAAPLATTLACPQQFTR